jgi:quinoprotein glucose dehydrogenase
MTVPRFRVTTAFAVLLVAFSILSGADAPEKTPPYTTWRAFGGGVDSMQYSALKQINKSNVAQLEQVWFYPAPAPDGAGRFAFAPTVVDNMMYVGGDDNRVVVALDATTGKEIWTHKTEGRPTDRGYAYWENKDRSQRRLFFSADSYLYAVDARTGKSINSFGNDGRVNLREGLNRDAKLIRNAQTGMPGQVWQNLLVLPAGTGEGYDDHPGWLRAFDVITGKQAWTFHTLPLPGEFGYETWPPEAYKYIGGVNTWSNFSIDEKRGIGYFPTGSPTFDLYGARRKGMGLFGNSLIALDLRTGKRLWHFQIVHHDLWDYDICNEPKLLTVTHNGKKVDIVAVGSKSGFLWVFNRVTGEPLWPIEEKPFPKSDVPGEESWPTQPVPTKPAPFSRQAKLTPDDINPYVDAAEREQLTKVLLAARNEGVYTPQSNTQDQISFPGEHGGTNWAGTAGDPETGMLYVRAENYPGIHHLFERSGTRMVRGGTPEQQGHALWSQFCEGCHGQGAAGTKTISDRSSEQIQAAVREGVGERMPSFSGTQIVRNAQSMSHLLAYIGNPAAGELPASAGESNAPEALPNGEERRFFGSLGSWWLTKDGLPATRPPWAELVAYDLNQGTIKWHVPVGTAPGLAAKGIKDTGAFKIVRNGPVVTAGGLIFMGTEPDRFVHAFDKDTGKLLWEKELNSNPVSIPAVYEVNGRQYVAFFASSGNTADNMGHKPSKVEDQGYYVFALPEKK